MSTLASLVLAAFFVIAFVAAGRAHGGDPAVPSAGEFLWRLVGTALSRSFGTADLISGALGALAAYLFRDSPDIMSDLAWQIPLYSLAAVTLIRLVAAPYWMWREEREEVTALSRGFRKPQLEIVFERRGSAFEHEETVQGVTLRRFRVGVRHSGRESVQRVQIELRTIAPQADPPIPVPLLLHLMHDDERAPGGDVVHQGEFSLDPDETRYIDVVSARDSGDRILILHIVRGLHRQIVLQPGRVFTLTLFAHGTDALSTSRRFWVTQSQNTGGRLFMSPPPGDSYGQAAFET